MVRSAGTDGRGLWRRRLLPNVTAFGSGISTASNPPTGPRATVVRSLRRSSETISCVGVRAPERTAAMRPSRHESPPYTALSSALASPVDTSTRLIVPNPSWFRVKTIDDPSGDHAYDRWPRPHDGSPCSSASSTRGFASLPSAAATQRFSHPVSSDRYASRVPSGEKRGCCTLTPAPPATTRASPDPSASRMTMRPSSHGMAGMSHSCHTTRVLSGDHDGSKQKSAAVDSLAGHAEPSRGATATCC